MRYYVLVDEQPAAYVIAEVLREEADDGRDRVTSYASGIAGSASLVLTREEMLEDPRFAAALQAWEAGDDHIADPPARRVDRAGLHLVREQRNEAGSSQ